MRASVRGPSLYGQPPAEKPARPEEATTLIRFNDVTFRYSGAVPDAPALRDVDFRVEPGEIVSVLGANGSGKSTLVRLANGLLLPESGSVVVDGIDTATNVREVVVREEGEPGAVPATAGETPQKMPLPPGETVREIVGSVFQHPDDQIVATSVEDDVAFGPENLGLPREEIRRRVDAALEAVGLTGFERREPHLLSGGQKQRLVIAGALAMEPRYLVLDEPTSMLDPHGRREVLSVVRALKTKGHGILLVTHDLAEAGRADRVVVLDRGSVVFEGLPAGLLARGDLARWGLERPPVSVLVEALRANGADIGPATVDPAAIAGALC